MESTEGARRRSLFAVPGADLGDRLDGPHHRNDGLDALLQPLENMVRFQYAVVNVGMFNSTDRMAGVLGAAGQNGWELVTVYDKGSNWMSGMEKGFLLLKRRVPDGVTVRQWCIMIKN